MTMLKTPSRAVTNMPRSGVRELMALADQRPDVLHLEVGEPNFETPAHIVEAAAQAGRDGFTKYTDGRGLASLREAITAKLAVQNGIIAHADEVIVTTGATT